MIQIYLDGKLAIPRSNATIKLTKENPYFTKSASYTYDVELPLDIAENRNIFGFLHRMDVPKSERTLSAQLIVENVSVLAGTAHIISVDEKSVKVQLLGEQASYNYGNKMEDTFIDELDLGDWYMTTWPDGSYWPTRVDNPTWQYYPKGTRFQGTNDVVISRAGYTENNGYDHTGQTLLDNLFSGKYPWVAFPINNSSADFLCNGYAYRFTSKDNRAVRFFLRQYEGQQTGRRPSDDPPVSSFAIQPYLWIMVEKIAAATGFTITKENNALYSDPFYNRIFIANANNYVECNKCLPHWSVNEWWTQIEQTFGLVLGIDYADRSMSLKKRKDHYTSDVNVIELNEVVDQYTVEVNDETEADISSNNVGYADFENGPEDLLSEFILDNAEFNDEFGSITDLQKWAGTREMSGYKNVLFRCKDGHQFIYSDNKGLIEVNMFRPRIVREKNEDIDIELKIVPARFVEYDCNIYPYMERASDGTGSRTDDKPLGTFPVKILQTPNISEMDWYKENYDEHINIDAIINEEEDEGSVKETSSEDVLYMAITDLSHRDSITATVKLTTGGEYTDTFMYPRAMLRARCVAPLNGTPETEDPGFSLSLIPIEGQTSLANATISENIGIMATVRYCIKFIADRIPDPGAIFLIHNKRFVCEKIEADIAATGLKRMITGYFYELNL